MWKKEHWILPIRASHEPYRLCKCLEFFKIIHSLVIFYFIPILISNLSQAWRLWTETKVLDLMDQNLHESCNADLFTKCVNVGLLCIQEDPSDRPTMSNVVTMLDSETVTVPIPKLPAFVLRRGESSASSIRPETYTEITTSLEEAA